MIRNLKHLTMLIAFILLMILMCGADAQGWRLTFMLFAVADGVMLVMDRYGYEWAERIAARLDD
ncbi:hypothetical protein [Bifidobacterium sp. SO1]|uniref:hypothetical protein n=1 Tax=Bifidobacterium sp. SO1 TaxID=2809029 RepID=UPI001BDC53A3|nr:hypothetical protein [Bifidobacterium sp. SO1]MBT1162922.1 hypothetical protein [Bifidobacterium sp. SO1]